LRCVRSDFPLVATVLTQFHCTEINFQVRPRAPLLSQKAMKPKVSWLFVFQEKRLSPMPCEGAAFFPYAMRLYEGLCSLVGRMGNEKVNEESTTSQWNDLGESWLPGNRAHWPVLLPLFRSGPTENCWAPPGGSGSSPHSPSEKPQNRP
jgi:hypothetical protein